MNKNIKDIFKDVKMNDEQSSRILNNVLNPPVKRHKLLKNIIITSLVLICCIFGGVYAVEKGNVFDTLEVLFKHKIDSNTKNEYDVASVKSNALAVVNYDADIPEYDGDNNDSLKHQYSFEELESMLGIKFLQSEYYKKDFINQGYTEKNNDKIARATFYMNDITSESNSKDGKLICDMTISFITKYDKEKEMKFVTGLGQGVAKREFFIEKLKTTAFVAQFWPEENAYVKYCYIYFNYENISYQFKMFIRGGNFEEQVKDFLNSFEYK